MSLFCLYLSMAIPVPGIYYQTKETMCCVSVRYLMDVSTFSKLSQPLQAANQVNNIPFLSCHLSQVRTTWSKERLLSGRHFCRHIFCTILIDICWAAGRGAAPGLSHLCQDEMYTVARPVAGGWKIILMR